ncbi:MAG: Na+/H+ antiporter NhaC [Flavobacteriales bacterium]|jgi:NhaC family Na+:H+ antiporter|nr:Na+/H+ antiporter NhaC [Flavobacteriales bacterium]
MEKTKIPFHLALLPFLVLIVLLALNVFLFADNSSYGYNQIALLLSGLIVAGIGVKYGFSWKEIQNGIVENISTSMKAILILLFIGALAGTWLISGIVPAMIYYGLDLLSPEFFLFASCIICALISLSTGSSWSTIGTVGIALLAIGKVLGFPEGWIAGAVISGAYFGDKMSPLSDTTNLAPAMAGTDLFTHIRYMLYTTLPSIGISLIIFLVYGFTQDYSGQVEGLEAVQTAITQNFKIHIGLFIIPLFTIALIIKKVDALLALFLGSLAGGVSAVFFQPELMTRLASHSTNAFLAQYEMIVESMANGVKIPSENKIVAELLSSSGMAGMLNTVWLILSAMFFSGTLEATGILKQISEKILSVVKSRFGLVFSTVSSCVFFNITASDQYLAIIVPGKMFSKAYQDKGLAPENLSRSLEDSGTVTSVLVPWNTCGAAQANILGVATILYLPYCFFNWISPLMTLTFALFKIKIRELKETKNAKDNSL